MFFVRYKLKQCEQFIQFDQFFSLNKFLFDPIVNFKGCEYGQGVIENPTVTVSLLPPKDVESWDEKTSFAGVKYLIIYSKEINGRIYSYVYSPMNIYTKITEIEYYRNTFVPAIFRLMMINIFLNNSDILYLHGILLNNGDIIAGDCFAGKTTLATRINNNNQNLKCICDDGVIIDLKNKLVYLTNYYWGVESPFPSYKPVDMTVPIKLNKIFILRKDWQEKIYEIDKDEWLKELYIASIHFYWHPFRNRLALNDYTAKWINFRKGLQQKAENDVKEKLKLLSSFKPLVVTTNTPDLNKKFEVLEDVI